MSNVNGIGVLPGNNISFIDHLVPLCQMMDIPLLVTDPFLQTLVEWYYPPMEIRYCSPENYLLDEELSPFAVYFYVEFYRNPHGSFQMHEYLTRNKARSVFSLHGNPDKYGTIYWMENVNDEDIILAYSSYLATQMHLKGLKKEPIISGNYRLAFYEKNETFFRKKLPFQKEKTTILYAPTWTSSDQRVEKQIHYSSFFKVYRSLFEKIPEHFQLIVKLHPHHLLTMRAEIEKIEQEYPHIYFLHDFPLIYPLLNEIDIYLGDYSSIGYDFLFFDRPLFFLSPAEKTPLQECGLCIPEEELGRVYELIQQTSPDLFSKKRKEIYARAFGERKELDMLKKEIGHACRPTAC